MLYMVDMEFREYARQAEWDAWYMAHVAMLLSVPGFTTAQRFRCQSQYASPYLAIYAVDSPQVFESVEYRNRGGRDSTGEWQPLMTNWHRNLFTGLERAPVVATDARLLVTESLPEDVAGCAGEFSWLASTGLDQTIARRGIAVASIAKAGEIVVQSRGLVRAYQPMTPQMPASRT